MVMRTSPPTFAVDLTDPMVSIIPVNIVFSLFYIS
jgi:hypothetical protein